MTYKVLLPSIPFLPRTQPLRPRKKTKTVITTVKMSPEVRVLWEQCAEHENRSLTNLFEVLLRDYAKRLGVTPDPQRVAAAAEATRDTPRVSA